MSYSLPQDSLPEEAQPAKHYAKLLRLPEFEHLRDGEARIEFIMRGHEKIRQGRRILGTCHLPTVQGQLKDVFEWMLEEKFGEMPDYLIELEMDFWLESSERDREVLIFHELLHTKHAIDKHGSARFDKEGNPVWDIRGHDVEEFAEVVRRYGLHSPDLVAFFAAADEHKAAGGL